MLAADINVASSISIWFVSRKNGIFLSGESVFSATGHIENQKLFKLAC